jgi:hypothetical protein
MIPVIHEDTESLKGWGLGLESMCERCTLCKQPTRLWHTDSNNPCCQDCAQKHTVEELAAARTSSREETCTLVASKYT